jgi:hypothetical protein
MTLSTAQLPQNNIDWAEVIMTADAEKEIFSNMRIVTARSEYISKAQELAIDELYCPAYIFKDSPQIDITIATANIIQSGQVRVRESATIYSDGIFVCLNVDVIDDDAVWKALDMVYLAMSNNGTWISDIPLTFDMTDLSFDFNIYK